MLPFDQWTSGCAHFHLHAHALPAPTCMAELLTIISLSQDIRGTFPGKTPGLLMRGKESRKGQSLQTCRRKRTYVFTRVLIRMPVIILVIAQAINCTCTNAGMLSSSTPTLDYACYRSDSDKRACSSKCDYAYGRDHDDVALRADVDL